MGTACNWNHSCYADALLFRFSLNHEDLLDGLRYGLFVGPFVFGVLTTNGLLNPNNKQTIKQINYKRKNKTI